MRRPKIGFKGVPKPVRKRKGKEKPAKVRAVEPIDLAKDYELVEDAEEFESPEVLGRGA